MKYMGSKRVMLQNGLGTLICETAKKSERFVDLFSGSGVVSWFAATRTNQPVLSVDLQKFSAVLSGAVISRTKPLNVHFLKRCWLNKANILRHSFDLYDSNEADKLTSVPIDEFVSGAREKCKEILNLGPVWWAYGGYYYSPSQALTLDAMIASLPDNEPARSVSLAALVCAASSCSASPGHTAQPLRPSARSEPYFIESWSRDPIIYAEKALISICHRYARVKGRSIVGDANNYAHNLRSTDLVFVDPPYSDVQYSRFYHVLETIVTGHCGKIEGAGRYPPRQERPQSAYSLKTKSCEAIVDLLETLASARCRVILTFPAGVASNGISGDFMQQIASNMFKIMSIVFKGQFSTLGGYHGGRSPRKRSIELIMILEPS